MNWANIGVWFGLMLVFLAVEAACPIHLVSVWFAVGALAAMVVSMLAGAIWLQILLFFVVSGVLLALLWPMVRKVLNPAHTPTNIDSVVGAVGLVTVGIDNVTSCGELKLGGLTWSARSTNGRPIPAGKTVRVDKIEGVKVFVTAVEEAAAVTQV